MLPHLFPWVCPASWGFSFSGGGSRLAARKGGQRWHDWVLQGWFSHGCINVCEVNIVVVPKRVAGGQSRGIGTGDRWFDGLGYGRQEQRGEEGRF